jgi:hypothetical protein
VISLRSRETEGGQNVRLLQIRMILKNFMMARAGCQEREDIPDSNAQTADAGTPPALPGFDSNALDHFHGSYLSRSLPEAL